MPGPRRTVSETVCSTPYAQLQMHAFTHVSAAGRLPAVSERCWSQGERPLRPRPAHGVVPVVGVGVLCRRPWQIHGDMISEAAGVVGY
jgi:hypothetical protein